ncbi:YbhN family protein [Patescibacteria group bacterium]
MKKKFIKSAKIFFSLVTLGLFGYLVFQSDISLSWQAVQAAKPLMLILSLMLTLSVFSLLTYKWSLFLTQLKINISFKELLKIFMIGLFYGGISPGNLGIFLRLKYLSDKTGKKVSRLMPTMLVDKLIEWLVLLILCLLALGLFLQSLINNKLLLGLGLGAVCLLIIVAVVNNQKNSRFNKQLLLKAIGLSLVGWALTVSRSYFLSQAFNIPIGFWQFSAVLVMVIAVSMLPISIGGLGVRELSLTILLGRFGVSPALVLPYLLTSYLLFKILPMLFGWILTIKADWRFKT